MAVHPHIWTNVAELCGPFVEEKGVLQSQHIIVLFFSQLKIGVLEHTNDGDARSLKVGHFADSHTRRARKWLQQVRSLCGLLLETPLSALVKRQLRKRSRADVPVDAQIGKRHKLGQDETILEI